MPTRRQRGYDTEHLVALYWRAHGWPHASVRRGPGVDLENVVGLSVEVKARRDFLPLAWLSQAAHKPGLPVVVWRPNGSGRTTIGNWPVMMRHNDFLRLLADAGYGDGWGEG